MVYLPHWPIPKKISVTEEVASGIEFERVKKILTKLENPQNKLPPVIHVAGTNGKGSTVAFLASIFQSAGYKTHIYTSPHLHHANERIVIANNQIDDNYLYEILEEVRIATGDIPLTLFEGLTLAAILAFSKNSADVCIIETGMGGRVDVTNVIENKILTILTSISYDHEDFLGKDIRAIAAEKSYIMRKNTPSIIAPINKESGAMIELCALEISAPLIHYDRDFQVEINEDETFNFFTSSSPQNDKKDIQFKNLSKPALLGQHQYLNSSLAIAGICAINNFKTGHFNINQAEINSGLINVKWPSRLEKVNNNLNKLLKNPNSEIYIDGAHNPAGALIISDWLKEKIIIDENSSSPKRNYLIVGFSKGKTKKEFFKPFLDLIDYICAIRLDGEPNPEDADVICEEILKLERDDEKEFSWCNSQDDLIDAINFLANLDQENPCRIIICGSLYLARDLKKSNKIVF